MSESLMQYQSKTLNWVLVHQPFVTGTTINEATESKSCSNNIIKMANNGLLSRLNLAEKQDELKFNYCSKSLDIHQFWTAGKLFPHVKCLQLCDIQLDHNQSKALCKHLDTVRKPMMPSVMKMQLRNVKVNRIIFSLMNKISNNIVHLVLNDYTQLEQVQFIPNRIQRIEIINPMYKNVQLAVTSIFAMKPALQTIDLQTTNEVLEKLFRKPLRCTLVLIDVDFNRNRHGVSEVRCHLTRSSKPAILYDEYAVLRVNQLIVTGELKQIITHSKYTKLRELPEDDLAAAEVLWKVMLECVRSNDNVRRVCDVETDSNKDNGAEDDIESDDSCDFELMELMRRLKNLTK